MPIREDERALRSNEDLQYCVICKRYLSPLAWREHEHNPAIQKARSIASLDVLMEEVVWLGPVKVRNCASVVVVQGVEVLRLRDRDGENRIRIDLDLRGPKDERLVLVQNGQVKAVASGVRFQDEGRACTVVEEQSGRELLRVEAMSSKVLAVQGTFHAGGLAVEMTGEQLSVGGEPVSEREVRGKGTAIVIRKKAPFIGSANR